MNRRAQFRRPREGEEAVEQAFWCPECSCVVWNSAHDCTSDDDEDVGDPRHLGGAAELRALAMAEGAEC